MMKLTLRGKKGSPLTYEEMDGNFYYLDQKFGGRVSVAFDGTETPAITIARVEDPSKLTGPVPREKPLAILYIHSAMKKAQVDDNGLVRDGNTGNYSTGTFMAETIVGIYAGQNRDTGEVELGALSDGMISPDFQFAYDNDTKELKLFVAPLDEVAYFGAVDITLLRIDGDYGVAVPLEKTDAPDSGDIPS